MPYSHRSGGKHAGRHTTMIDASDLIYKIAIKCPEVARISTGTITAGVAPANGRIRVKIIEDGGSIRLDVRGNVSIQVLRIYAKHNLRDTKMALAKAIRNGGIAICFK